MLGKAKDKIHTIYDIVFIAYNSSINATAFNCGQIMLGKGLDLCLHVQPGIL